MKLARVRSAENNQILYGMIKDRFYPAEEDIWQGLAAKGLDEIAFSGTGIDFKKVKFLPPTMPTKIVAVGLNYRSHAEEMKIPIPDEPLIFFKPPSAVIGHEDVIQLPAGSRRVDYECELAIVIGRKAKNITEAQAPEYVLGYTCFNDVTERYNQKKDGQWSRAKGYDTFAPAGPWIETGLDPSACEIRTVLNGKIVQKGNTSDLIFPVGKLVSFISCVMTLEPGDLIATGTPAGIGPMNDGDKVEIMIEGIGTLTNYAKILRVSK